MKFSKSLGRISPSFSAQGCVIPGAISITLLSFFYNGAQYLCVLCMELASCRLSGAKNFEVASSFFFLEICTPLP
jgi:hypothetical protein